VKIQWKPSFIFKILIAILVLAAALALLASGEFTQWLILLSEADPTALKNIIALQAILQLCITPVFTGLSLIAIMYGFMYHMFVGWLLCAFGAMIGAIWVFLLVRYFFRNALITKYGDTKWCQVALMAMREKAFIYSFLLRMTPLHFGMTTLVCAVSEISFARFLLATFLGMNVEMPLYVFAGTTLRKFTDISSGDLDDTQAALVGVECTIIVVMLVVITLSVRRVLKRYHLQSSTAFSNEHSESVNDDTGVCIDVEHGTDALVAPVSWQQSSRKDVTLQIDNDDQQVPNQSNTMLVDINAAKQ